MKSRHPSTSPAAPERAARADQVACLAEAAVVVVGLAGAVATVGIRYFGWQPGFSAELTGFVAVTCAGLDWLLRASH